MPQTVAPNVSESSIKPVAGPYRRVILKLSGESFAAPGERGISMQEVVNIAAQTYRAKQQGVEIAIDGVAKAATVQNAQMNTLIKARDADLRAARPAPANGAFDPRPAG